MTSVLHQEESLAARHHTNAEAGEVGIEGDIVSARDPERLDRPLGDLDLRHATPVRVTFRPSGFWSACVSWKRRGSGATKVVA